MMKDNKIIEGVMYFKEQLESIKKGLDEYLGDLLKELQELPPGRLYIYEKRGRYYYCQRFPKEGRQKKEHRISVTYDSETALALVRKKYVENAIEIIRKDIKALSELISDYGAVNEESVMDSFLKKYPELREGIFFEKRNLEEWATSYLPSNSFYAEDLKSVSVQGEKMRSAGEMYIASRLDHFGIPYRYEAPVPMPDLSYSPDFTILRPRDRKIIYWEHVGMINDAEYVQRNIEKVCDYIDCGIRPWDNLIMTFNNEKGGFDGRLIDAMIECRIL